MTDLEQLLSSEFSGHGAKRLFATVETAERRARRSEINREWQARECAETRAERFRRIGESVRDYIKQHGHSRTGAVLTAETRAKISQSQRGVQSYGKNGRARAVRTPLGVFDTLTRAAEAHGLARRSGGACIRKRIKKGVPGYEYV
jgi:hypothetical protein